MDGSAGQTPLADKWAALEPHWYAVRRTGYGQAVRIAAKRLHGMRMSALAHSKPWRRIRDLVAPGSTVLREVAGVDSARWTRLMPGSIENERPLLLMAHLHQIYMGPDWRRPAAVTGTMSRIVTSWGDRLVVRSLRGTRQPSKPGRTDAVDFADVPADEVAEPPVSSRDPVSNMRPRRSRITCSGTYAGRPRTACRSSSTQGSTR